MVRIVFSPSSIRATRASRIQLLDRVLAGRAGATEELERLVDDLHRLLRHRDLACRRHIGVSQRRQARVGERTARHGAAQLHSSQHVAEPIARELMVDELRAALLALVAVLQGQLERGARDTGERLAHVRPGERPRRGHVAVVLVLQRHGEALRDAHVVEVDLALRQRPLADLLQRLALRNAGQVERNDHGHAVRIAVATEEAVVVLGAEIAQRDLRHGAVRHPGRALPVDHDFVALQAAPHVALVARLAGGQLGPDVDHRHVAALVGMGDHPAADLAGAEVHQFLVAHDGGHLHGEARDDQADGEPGIAPAEFLADQRLHADRDLGRQLGQHRRDRVPAWRTR